MAEYNPFQSMMNPNAARTGLWDLRMMSAANRMETPFEHGARGGYPRSAALGRASGGVPEEPDLSQFTYDPAMRARAIEAGVTPLSWQQVKNNVILPNTGFFGNHPNLSSALEGGLLGALASHGGATAGESIQGAIEGMIGGPQARQSLWRKQFEGPFQAANVLEGLQDRVQKRQLQSMDIEHLRAVDEHYKRGDDEKAQALENTQRHQEVMETIGAQNAATSAAREADTRRHQEAIEGISLQRAQLRQQGAGAWYTYKDPKTQKTLYGRMHEGEAVPAGAQMIQGDYASKEADRQTAARSKWVQHQLDNPASMRRVLGNGYNPKDMKATTSALEKWYQENVQGSQADGVYDPNSGTVVQNPR